MDMKTGYRMISDQPPKTQKWKLQEKDEKLPY